MKRIRSMGIGIGAVLLSACISYPGTKILVTPIGAAGIHSFAPPERSPDVTRDATQRLARMTKDD
ncbi:hypothetical protein [Povalibacter sp.]|uniref:hypothetical protein n=1 Tax=Povalibacter sp. TaxID=1962978 RepID=UPI002F3E8D9B